MVTSRPDRFGSPSIARTKRRRPPRHLGRHAGGRARRHPVPRPGFATGRLLRVLRRGAREGPQSPVFHDRQPGRRRRAHAGRLPEAVGAMGHDRPDRRSHGVPVPRRAERIADASALRTPSRAKDGRTHAVVRSVRRDRRPRRRPTRCCSSWRRANGPPSSCSISTATARKRRDASWASAPRPCARSPPKAAPSSGPPEVHMAELRRSSRWSRRRSSLTWTHGSELDEQQQRAARNRKVGALAVAAVIVAAIALFASVALNRGRDGTAPATVVPTGPGSGVTFTVVGTDGSVVIDHSPAPLAAARRCLARWDEDCVRHRDRGQLADRHDADRWHGDPHPSRLIRSLRSGRAGRPTGASSCSTRDGISPPAGSW